MRFDLRSVDCGQPDCSLLTVEQPQITIHRDPEGEAIGAESHASNR